MVSGDPLENGYLLASGLAVGADETAASGGRMDEPLIQEDESVECSICGRRYETTERAEEGEEVDVKV